jgi:hypothetical protein
MGCLIPLFRAFVALVLFVIIFVSFLSYLIVNNVAGKLLSADFYTNTLESEDTYNRIYNDVLLDGELEQTTRRLLGDIQIASNQEVVELLREIMPPEYIQSEVEGAIGRTVDYFNEDAENLGLYIDLNLPLNNVKPVMINYIDKRILELEVEDSDFSGCSLNAAQSVADTFRVMFDQLAGGVVPKSAPSLEEIKPVCRVIIFELAYGSLIDGAGLNESTSAILENSKEDLRAPFENGDTIQVLKVSARLLAEPKIDTAIDGVRENLTGTGQFDLISQIVEWDGDRTESQLRADLAGGRDWISKASNFGDMTSLVMVIGGTAIMGLIFFPTLSGMLRWPGTTLIITGGFFFAVGKIAQSKVPEALSDAWETSADRVSDVPPAVTDLGTDILVSFGSQLTDGFVAPSITMLTFGVILLSTSFSSIILKRFIPVLK